MSGSYVNGAAVGGGGGGGGGGSNRRHKRAPTTPSSPASLSTAERGRQSSVRRRPQRSRPRSVLSQRISQVYDLAADGRPACLHRAAVSPALWLLCQAVLVVLFAICSAYLTSGRDKRNPPMTASGLGIKPWMRLQFDLKAIKLHTGVENAYNTIKEKPYNWLICSKDSKFCNDMHTYFQLSNRNNETTIVIKKEAVYRINAAVTFHTLENKVFPVDISVRIGNENWITCQEGAPSGYVHCALFGIRHLPKNSIVSFVSHNYVTIAAHGGSTFFEIEMR